MHRHLLYVLPWLFLISLAAFAQDGDKVEIAGVVVDADSVLALPNVHLQVPATGLGGVTDADGRFRFRVSPEDTIVFSSVGYAPFYLLPADSSAESLQKLVIRLQPQVTMLEGVEVKDYIDVSHYLQPKIDSTVDMRRSRGTPLFEDQEAREPNAVGTAGGLNGARLEGGLTALANLFNDDFQQRKKLKEILAMEEKQAQEEALRKAMTEKYHLMLAAAADLSENDVDRFTDLYMPPPRRMLQMTDYQVMESILFYMAKFEPEGDFLQDLLKNGKFEGEGRGETYQSKGRRPPTENP